MKLLSWKTRNREKLEIEKTSEDEDENKKTLGIAVHDRKKTSCQATKKRREQDSEERHKEYRQRPA
jgi:hypothetical protein